MNKQEFITNLNKAVDKDLLVNLVIDLCKQNTVNPPGNEYLTVPIVKSFLERINPDSIEIFEKEKGRSNLVARVKGNKSGPSVAIIGHTDVVPTEGQKWDTDPFNPVVKGNKIYARGSADNKGPFAAALEAVRSFLDIVDRNFAGEIILISSADEETSCDLGIKYLFNELGLKCDLALVPDGGNFSKIVYGEMGTLVIEFESTGKAWHGSQPENGISALVPLGMLSNLLYDYKWDELVGHEDFGSTVLNIGIMNSGSAMNIVPDHGILNAMWRYPTGVKVERIEEIVDKLVKEVSDKYDFSNIKYTRKHFSVPFIGDKASALVQAALLSSDDLNLQKQTLKTIKAETVAKYINQACGADVIVNGVFDGQGDLMHVPNEYIEIDSSVNFAKYYAMILYNLLVDPK